MQTKLVTQYRCDHCGKRGYSAGAMRKHESRCTLNPKRECGMCARIGEAPKPMSELLAILAPVAKDRCEPRYDCDDFDLFCKAAEKAMPALRDAANYCPACILAAIRQSGIPVHVTGFDFRAECKSFWDEVNANREVPAGPMCTGALLYQQGN